MARSHRTLRLAAVASFIGAFAAAGVLQHFAAPAAEAVQIAPFDPAAPNSDLPPVRFQGLDTATIVITAYVPEAAVQEVCEHYGLRPVDGYSIGGCKVSIKGETVIIVPTPCERPGAYMTPSYVACHEIGHVNGWRHEAE